MQDRQHMQRKTGLAWMGRKLRSGMGKKNTQTKYKIMAKHYTTSKNKQDFISKCIRKERRAGIKQEQAIAICMSKARREGRRMTR